MVCLDVVDIKNMHGTFMQLNLKFVHVKNVKKEAL